MNIVGYRTLIFAGLTILANAVQANIQFLTPDQAAMANTIIGLGFMFLRIITTGPVPIGTVTPPATPQMATPLINYPPSPPPAGWPGEPPVGYGP